MARKSSKKIMNRLYRETKYGITEHRKRIAAEGLAEIAQEKADRYEKRFRDFGTNVETVEPTGKLVECIKWTLQPVPYGQYAVVSNEAMRHDDEQRIAEQITRTLVKAAMENNLVQFVRHEGGFMPFDDNTTIAAKMYVVPWEQMPHKRTVELAQYVEGWSVDQEGVR